MAALAVGEILWEEDLADVPKSQLHTYEQWARPTVYGGPPSAPSSSPGRVLPRSGASSPASGPLPGSSGAPAEEGAASPPAGGRTWKPRKLPPRGLSPVAGGVLDGTSSRSAPELGPSGVAAEVAQLEAEAAEVRAQRRGDQKVLAVKSSPSDRDKQGLNDRERVLRALLGDLQSLRSLFDNWRDSFLRVGREGSLAIESVREASDRFGREIRELQARLPDGQTSPEAFGLGADALAAMFEELERRFPALFAFHRQKIAELVEINRDLAETVRRLNADLEQNKETMDADAEEKQIIDAILREIQSDKPLLEDQLEFLRNLYQQLQEDYGALEGLYNESQEKIRLLETRPSASQEEQETRRAIALASANSILELQNKLDELGESYNALSDENRAYARENEQFANRIKVLDKHIKELEIRLEHVEQENASLENEKDELEQDFDALQILLEHEEDVRERAVEESKRIVAEAEEAIAAWRALSENDTSEIAQLREEIENQAALNAQRSDKIVIQAIEQTRLTEEKDALAAENAELQFQLKKALNQLGEQGGAADETRSVEEIAALNAQVSKLTAELEATQARADKVDVLEARIRGLENQEGVLEAALGDKDSEIQQVSAKLAQAQEANLLSAATQATVDQLERENAAVNQKAEQLEQQLNTARDDCEIELDRLRREIAELERLLKECEDKLLAGTTDPGQADQLRAEISRLEQQLADLQAERNAVQANLQVAEREQATAEARADAAEASAAQAREAASAKDAELREKDGQLDTAQQELTTATSSSRSAEGIAESLRKENEDLKLELQEHEVESTRLTEELIQAKHEIDRLRDSSLFGGANARGDSVTPNFRLPEGEEPDYNRVEAVVEPEPAGEGRAETPLGDRSFDQILPAATNFGTVDVRDFMAYNPSNPKFDQLAAVAGILGALNVREIRRNFGLSNDRLFKADGKGFTQLKGKPEEQSSRQLAAAANVAMTWSFAAFQMLFDNGYSAEIRREDDVFSLVFTDQSGYEGLVIVFEAGSPYQLYLENDKRVIGNVGDRSEAIIKENIPYIRLNKRAQRDVDNDKTRLSDTRGEYSEGESAGVV